MLRQIRQGDIYLEAVDVKPPAGAAVCNYVILAEGEITGHAHVVEAPTIVEWSAAEQRYIRVLGDQPGTISHADHDPMPTPVLMPEQTYRVVRQRVFNLANEWEQVRD